MPLFRAAGGAALREVDVSMWLCALRTACRSAAGLPGCRPVSCPCQHGAASAAFCRHGVTPPQRRVQSCTSSNVNRPMPASAAVQSRVCTLRCGAAQCTPALPFVSEVTGSYATRQTSKPASQTAWPTGSWGTWQTADLATRRPAIRPTHHSECALELPRLLSIHAPA